MDCSYSKIEHIVLDFDDTEVGLTKIKSIKIANQSNSKQSYAVQRDPASNPLDSAVFNAVEYTWTLQPCESYVCDVSFRPILPNRKYTDYFFITNTHKCCYKVVARGFSLGPKVSSSRTRLILSCDNEENRKARTASFKLINESSVPAKFAFDVDADQLCPFKISETSGVLKQSSSKSFAVSFEPGDNRGIYKYHLTCLVLNQEPVIIELFGLCSCGLEKKCRQVIFLKIEDTPELDATNAYANYMSDVISEVKNSPPTISLSDSYIDFGRVEVSAKNFTKQNVQTVCLTNNNNFDVFAMWAKDASKEFSIEPAQVRVPSNQSIIFEIQFDPRKDRAFYSRELTARIFRIPNCSSNDRLADESLLYRVPEFAALRLIGHTYKHGLNDWMPQYEIPEALIMPACVPAWPVYTTFAMRNFGQQPLMFSFVPPAVSHYSVKPMMGLISNEQEYQVIVVQLFPESEADQSYVERWAVRLNGNSKNEIYIDFQGFAEHASLTFGDAEKNSISFDPVHAGCRLTQAVPVRNSSRHTVRYEYLSCNLPRELAIEQTSGVVHPNETITQDWIFSPDQLRDYDFEVCCRASCINQKVNGRYSIVRVDVSGKSAEGCLLAVPEELSFGDRAYNERSEIEFKAFNFSPVPIHFQLSCRPTKSLETLKSPEHDVEISPKSGTICPGKGDKIRVVLNPTQPGYYELTIEYSIRFDSSSDSLIPRVDPKSLCTVTCMCYLPTLQIKDLLYRAEAIKGVSKFSLWDSMNIDGLNAALKELMPHEAAAVEMTLPSMTFNESEKFIVKLSLGNSNPIRASWSLKKRRTCLCGDPSVKSKSVKPNAKGDCLYCVYDQSCLICPKNVTLSENETAVLTIELGSETLQPDGIFWDLKIGENRTVVINLKLETPIILSGPHLRFKDMYVGQCKSTHYKAIWLYNNDGEDNSYAIDMNPIVLYNRKNYGIIFTCLSPDGVVQAKNRKPVLFGFQPNRIGDFEIVTSVKLGNKESFFRIEGISTCCSLSRPMVVAHETCPSSDTFKDPEIMAYFNDDCAIFPTLLTHGKAPKLIMVHNNHQHDVLSYQWKNYEIPGIIKVIIEPTNGIIQPQSLITFLIEVCATSYECSLDIDIECDFVDVSERRIAEKKRSEQEAILKSMKDEFTITEKGLLPQKMPLTFSKSLRLKVNVYNSQDIEFKVDLMDQLKNTPPQEIALNSIRSSDNDPSIHNVKNWSTIFENIIWDVVNSKSFAEIVKNNLATKHDLKYSQLPTNLVERKYQVERNIYRPPKQHIETILKSMICMIIHEKFKFDTTHFSHPPDVRQISFQKFYTEVYNTLSNDTKNHIELN